MSARQRITLTLPTEVLVAVRAESQGNVSRFIASVLSSHFDKIRHEQLRQRLVAGYLAEAESDLSLSEEFHHSDQEMVERYLTE
ncbi:hypothetical protein IV102_21395 [bacterium]|nr:hypothetical protein [bacterium]